MMSPSSTAVYPPPLSKASADDLRFLSLAAHVSSWSLDPSTKTGAVLVDAHGDVVGLGENRFPRRLRSTPERLNHRDTKYKLMCHCERVAANAAGIRTRGCTLYTWPFMSCAVCASHMADAGIAGHVAPLSLNPRWLADFELATGTYLETSVEVRIIDPEDLTAAGLVLPQEGGHQPKGG